MENNCIIDFKTFETKFKNNYDEIKNVILYINNIENSPINKNYNVIKSFHLFLILFLNKYGLDYHKMKKNEVIRFIKINYKDLKIKKGLLEFLIRNKVSSESRIIIKYLKLN